MLKLRSSRDVFKKVKFFLFLDAVERIPERRMGTSNSRRRPVALKLIPVINKNNLMSVPALLPVQSLSNSAVLNDIGAVL